MPEGAMCFDRDARPPPPSGATSSSPPAPRRFGVAVLVGWIGGGVAIFASSYAFLRWAFDMGLDIGRAPIIIFGLTLVALLVVAVLLARDPTAEAGPAAGG
jgi:hypothetical protein